MPATPTAATEAAMRPLRLPSRTALLVLATALSATALAAGKPVETRPPLPKEPSAAPLAVKRATTPSPVLESWPLTTISPCGPTATPPEA